MANKVNKILLVYKIHPNWTTAQIAAQAKVKPYIVGKAMKSAGIKMGNPVSKSKMERFWAKVAVSTDRSHEGTPCWEWQGGIGAGGYGLFCATARDKKSHVIVAHRFLYLHAVGPVPEGMELDHLCRNPKCVRPNHLEPVSHKINMLRGASPGVAILLSTACSKGHTKDIGAQCLVCAKEGAERFQARHKAKMEADPVYREKNLRRQSAACRARYHKNLEASRAGNRARAKKRYAENAAAREYMKQYNKSEKAVQYQKEYWANPENKQRRADAVKAWQKAHPEEVKRNWRMQDARRATKRFKHLPGFIVGLLPDRGYWWSCEL